MRPLAETGNVPPQTPLLRPDRYFAERDLHGGRVLLAVGIVLVSALGLAYGVGHVLTSTVESPALDGVDDREADAWADEQLANLGLGGVNPRPLRQCCGL